MMKYPIPPLTRLRWWAADVLFRLVTMLDSSYLHRNEVGRKFFEKEYQDDQEAND